MYSQHHQLLDLVHVLLRRVVVKQLPGQHGQVIVAGGSYSPGKDGHHLSLEQSETLLLSLNLVLVQLGRKYMVDVGPR